jgi:hypothetical protein
MSQVPDYVLEVRAGITFGAFMKALFWSGVFTWVVIMVICQLIDNPNEIGLWIALLIFIGMLAYQGKTLFWYAFGKEVFRVQGNQLTVYYRNCYASKKETFRLNQMWRIRITQREETSLASNIIFRLIVGIFSYFDVDVTDGMFSQGKNNAPIINFVYKAQEREFGTEISEAQARELFRYLLEKGCLQSNQFQKSRA